MAGRNGFALDWKNDMNNKLSKILLVSTLLISCVSQSLAEDIGSKGVEKADLKAALDAVKYDQEALKNPGKITLDLDDSLWEAEKDAITRYEASPESQQEQIKSHKSKINRLDEVGDTYTADNLIPLDQLDFTLGDWPLLGSINDIEKEAPSKVLVKGPFTTYTYDGIEATVYSGPASKAKRQRDPLQNFVGYYWYDDGAISALHATSKRFKTIREIGPGNSRGEVVFSYGAPNAAWRNLKTGDVFFAYVWNKKNDKVTKETIQNDSKLARNKDKQYLVFAFHNSQVQSVDLIDGQVWSRFAAPATDLHTYPVGQLSDEDFVLRGRRLGDHFVNDGDESWTTQGQVYGSSFIGYNDYAVSAGEDHLINRIYVNHDTPTRRGICIGDTAYLMLFVYGRPQRVYQSFDGNDSLRVYQYRNPQKQNEYLLFVVDRTSKFIKNIMLSDRPVDQLH